MFPKYQITIPIWLEFSQEVRNEFVSVFNLKRTGSTQVNSMGGKLVVATDGYTHEDLSAVTVERMQEFLGSDEQNFWTLLEKTYDKIHKKFEPKKEEPSCDECGGKNEKHKKTCQKALATV